MGKQQLSTIDVAAEVAYLRQNVLGMNLINVFDINSKTYVLKLGISGDDGKKVFILLESGRRCHTTKLRKHIRNRRLNDVRQLGVDRIVDFSFGHEEKCIHLILEMYAQGNIILTDSKYEVLTLLRTHQDTEQGYCLMPKGPYPLQCIRMPRLISEEDLREALCSTEDYSTFKSVIGRLLPYGSACAEHVLLKAKIQPSDKIAGSLDQAKFSQLMTQIKSLESWFNSCTQKAPEGYILLKEGKPSEDGVSVYTEFEPFLLFQHQSTPHLKFGSLDEALDEFFSKIEGQKLAQAEAAAKTAAEARLQKTKRDLESRAAKLKEDAAKEELQGQLIEYNLQSIEDVLLAVNSVLAQGMSWDEIETLIKNESEAKNPVAGLVSSLKLEQNMVIVCLQDILHEEQEKKVKVELDLSLGAAANARAHYEKRKKYALKEQRTHEANELALKAAERKVQSEMKKNKPKQGLHQLRKVYWFEKFNWFISSENYLVISGKDAQQNELLVKKYLRDEDIYVHADFHGASTTIVRNNRPGKTIPPISLQQAGIACICRSKAWESKVVTSAWWVYSHQVSKSAPTGEYLTTGSFMIRGKKNYFPPVSLIFGFGFLFRLEDSCIEHHKGERLPRLQEDQEDIIKPTEKKESSENPVLEEQEVEKSALDAFMDGSVDTLSKEMSSKLSIYQTEGPSISEEAIKGKKKNSAKEKRKQKSKADLEFTGEIPSRLEEEISELNKAGMKSRTTKKKGKRREKDEEDVKLMAELLQSSGQKKTKQQRREERKQKKAAKRAAAFNSEGQPTEEEMQSILTKATEIPFLQEDESKVEDPAEDEELVLPESEEEEELTELQQLETLTGNPLPEDTVLFAVPVCGPYEALSTCKYKVKLLPGTVKKGKGGRQAVDLLVHASGVHQRDVVLMKEVPETETTNVMLAGVKLSMPGMQKIKQNQKTKKKKTQQQQQQ